MKFLSSQTVIQFIKFGMVGISNTLLSLAVYYVFLWIDETTIYRLFALLSIIILGVRLALLVAYTQCFVRLSSHPMTRFARRSTSARNRAASASEGMRKPVRGETVKASTAGPSMRQERLNCCEK